MQVDQHDRSRRANGNQHDYHRPRRADDTGQGGHHPGGSASLDPDRADNTWPLRETDPAGVADYRSGSGGTADVCLAVTPTGRRAAIKILRAGAWAPVTCRREFRLASMMDAACTAPTLDHGERYADGVVQCSRGWAAPEHLWITPATPAMDVFAWGLHVDLDEAFALLRRSARDRNRSGTARRHLARRRAAGPGQRRRDHGGLVDAHRAISSAAERC
ncbi:hypothetical protein GCM10010199_08550 [Dactylosporangium roseum]